MTNNILIPSSTRRRRKHLGPLMCDIWLAIDYLNSNAAVLNMLIISFDRYFSVTRPLTYRAKRTTKHACLMISCAWILSLGIWTPAIFTYPYYKGRTVQGTDKCEIEFVKANTYLTFVTAILAFYIPVIIMIYLYWRIWLETKKRYRDLTTLFLVSGVGAAAPPTRHVNRAPAALLAQTLQPVIHNSNCCSTQSANAQAINTNISSNKRHPSSLAASRQRYSMTGELVQQQNASEKLREANQLPSSMGNILDADEQAKQTAPKRSRTAGTKPIKDDEQRATSGQLEQPKGTATSLKSTCKCARCCCCCCSSGSKQSNCGGSSNFIGYQRATKLKKSWPKSGSNPKSRQSSASCKLCCQSPKALVSADSINLMQQTNRQQQISSSQAIDCSNCDRKTMPSSAQATGCRICSSKAKRQSTALTETSPPKGNSLEQDQSMAAVSSTNPTSTTSITPASEGLFNLVNFSPTHRRSSHQRRHHHHHAHPSLDSDPNHRHHHHHHHHHHQQQQHNHHHHHQHHHHHHQQHHDHHQSHHNHNQGHHPSQSQSPSPSPSQSQHHHHHNHHGRPCGYARRQCRKSNIKQIDNISDDKQQQELLSIKQVPRDRDCSPAMTDSLNTKQKDEVQKLLMNDDHATVESNQASSKLTTDTNKSPSLLTSSYQLLSSSSKSLSCASILRKVHPISQSRQMTYASPTPAAATNKDEDKREYDDMREFVDKTGPEVTDQHGRETKMLVDSACSPIQFPSSPAVEEAPPSERHPIAILPSDSSSENEADRDLETRITRSGNMFRFESVDFHESPVSWKHPSKSKTTTGTATTITSSKQIVNCHRQGCRGLSKVVKHTYRCCSDAIMVHDAECRLCNPYGYGRRHSICRGSSKAGGSIIDNKCIDCANRYQSINVAHKCRQQTDKGNLVEVYKEHDKRLEGLKSNPSKKLDQVEYSNERRMIELEENNANLPILGPLKPQGCLALPSIDARSDMASNSTTLMERSRGSNLSNNSDIKSVRLGNKKLSQRLTFSDILIERSSVSSKSLGRDTSDLTISHDAQQTNGSTSNMNDNGRFGFAWLKRIFRSKLPTNGAHLKDDTDKSLDESITIEQSSNPDKSFLKSVCCSNTNKNAASANRPGSNITSSACNLSPSCIGKIPSSYDSSSQKNSYTSGEDGDNNNLSVNRGSSNINQHTSSSSKSSYSSSHHPIQPKSERKAAKTLSTLLLVFIATWLPYNILVLIKTLSGGEGQVPEKIWNFSYYLCYINSTINPLCYALCNAQFRRTYMRILKCKLSNEHNSTRRLAPLQSSSRN